MDTIPLDLAFTRLGAVIPEGQRALCATAQDGSLVLVCQASGFSRPRTGVLRYSAKLSLLTAPRTRIDALRVGLDAASSGSTPVRLIIHTPGVNGAARRVHMRADLVGSVTAFDGDAYSVDFVRMAEEVESPPPRGRRKR
jgi:hypothetical protein